MPSKAAAKRQLLGSDDEEEDAPAFSVNKRFAKSFEERKAKQLLSKRRARDSSDDESDSESEDEHGEALDAGLDTKIMRVINAIREKDPKIYEDQAAWFDKRAAAEGREEADSGGPDSGDSDSDSDSDSGSGSDSDSGNDSTNRRRKRKPKGFKDLVREQILEGNAGEDGQVATAKKGEAPLKVSQLMYNEEQRELRQAFLADGGEGSESDDAEEGGGDLFKVKQWAPSEDPKVEAALYNEIDRFKATATEGDAAAEDAFLHKFISERKWRDDLDSDDEGGFDGAELGMKIIGADGDSEDEEAVEAAEDFESKYNFRFEEEGGAEIVTYARDTGDSVRRKDDRRKQARSAKKARREREKLERLEELKRLKNEKAKAIRSRLRSITEIAGMGRRGGSDDEEEDAGEDFSEEMRELAAMGITKELLEEDWDATKFDAQMSRAFNDDYYTENDSGFDPRDARLAGAAKDEVFDDAVVETYEDADDDAEEDGEGLIRRGSAEDDEDEDEDEDGDGGFAGAGGEDDEDEGGRERGRLPGAVEEKIREELYKLDYEDTIGTGDDLIKCRFKYASVPRNDFGLSAEDVLLADDKELNTLVSLKRLVPYRDGPEYRLSTSRRSKWRREVRKRIEAEMVEAKDDKDAPSDWRKRSKAASDAKAATADAASNAAPTGKKKTRRAGRKKRSRDEEAKPEDTLATAAEAAAPSGKKRRKKRGKKGDKGAKIAGGDNRGDRDVAGDSASAGDGGVPAAPANGAAENKVDGKRRRKGTKAPKKKTGPNGVKVDAARLAAYGFD